MDYQEEKCCETCKHCDVDDWYCYEHYKDIKNIKEDVCDEWEEYE